MWLKPVTHASAHMHAHTNAGTGFLSVADIKNLLEVGTVIHLVDKSYFNPSPTSISFSIVV